MNAVVNAKKQNINTGRGEYFGEELDGNFEDFWKLFAKFDLKYV